MVNGIIVYGENMGKLKVWVLLLVSIIAIVAIVLNFDKIKEQILNLDKKDEKKLIIGDSNEYTKLYGFKYVNINDQYIPHNVQDIMNIYYSVLNQGWTEFTFYCPDDYENCLNDIDRISNNEIILSNINDYVHPYNSYASIRTTYDDQGTVMITIKHVYSDEEIKKIDKDIDRIIADHTDNSQTTMEKIRALHDYIINETRYDTDKITNGSSEYDSSRIQGVLYDKHAICSGYADIMSVILYKLGIQNFKVSSKNHVWNAVRMDNSWYHLDLTWDDPVSTTGIDTLIDTYFMITTSKLEEIDENRTEGGEKKPKEEHQFDKKVFSELVI